MSIYQLPTDDSSLEPKRPKVYPHPALSFSEEDKVGTIQPDDNTLVITLRIEGYEVKKVMINDGSEAEIMYPDLYKGLKLRPEDLTPYSSPLLSFDGKTVMPKGQIRLPVQTGPEIVEVDFIVAKPWLHNLGVVASTLHHKVKFPSKGRALEIQGC